MLRTIVVASLALALLCTSLSAQTPSSVVLRKNIVKLNPVSLMALTANVAYERMLGRSVSAQIGLLHTWFTRDVGTLPNYGFAITPELRYYVGGDGYARGHYFGFFMRYHSLQVLYDASALGLPGDARLYRTSQSMGIGFHTGRQWILNDWITAEVFAGVRRYFTLTEPPGVNSDEFAGPNFWFDGWGVRAGVSVGFVF